MTRDEFINNFWNYYLVLEKRFINTTEFVTVSMDNYKTYSIEYNMLLQSICSELDVVFKEISNFNQNDFKKIDDYYTAIRQKFPQVFTEKVRYISNQVVLEPFKNWSLNFSPFWWKAYNNVKHARLISYKDGNLENVINALAGLYMIEMYEIKEIAANSTNSKDKKDIPDDESMIFSLENFDSKCKSMKNIYIEELDNF